jgi:NitT/TauT family transport system ATP-binding protein
MNFSQDVPVLQAKDLTIQYHQAAKITVAVYKVSFELYRAERITVVGRSGCGKSTLLNAIAGFIEVADGVLTLNEKTITSSGSDRIVIFQEHALLPWKTALENVIFPLIHVKKYSIAEAKKKSLQMLETVGLADLANKYPHQLSGGQKQRVSIARGLVLEPEILLMDEPFSALDQMTKNNLQDELIRLCNITKSTVFFITHDIREAIKVGDRILVLSSQPGQIIANLRSRHKEGAIAIEEQKNQIEQLLGVK